MCRSLEETKDSTGCLRTSGSLGEDDFPYFTHPPVQFGVVEAVGGPGEHDAAEQGEDEAQFGVPVLCDVLSGLGSFLEQRRDGVDGDGRRVSDLTPAEGRGDGEYLAGHVGVRGE